MPLALTLALAGPVLAACGAGSGSASSGSGASGDDRLRAAGTTVMADLERYRAATARCATRWRRASISRYYAEATGRAC